MNRLEEFDNLPKPIRDRINYSITNIELSPILSLYKNINGDEYLKTITVLDKIQEIEHFTKLKNKLKGF